MAVLPLSSLDWTLYISLQHMRLQMYNLKMIHVTLIIDLLISARDMLFNQIILDTWSLLNINLD